MIHVRRTGVVRALSEAGVGQDEYNLKGRETDKVRRRGWTFTYDQEASEVAVEYRQHRDEETSKNVIHAVILRAHTHSASSWGVAV